MAKREKSAKKEPGFRSRRAVGSLSMEHEAADNLPLGKRGRNSGRGLFESFDFEVGERNDVVSMTVDLKQTRDGSYRVVFNLFQLGEVQAKTRGQVFALRLQEMRGKRISVDLMVISTEFFRDLVKEASRNAV